MKIVNISIQTDIGNEEMDLDRKVCFLGGIF